MTGLKTKQANPRPQDKYKYYITFHWPAYAVESIYQPLFLVDVMKHEALLMDFEI